MMDESNGKSKTGFPIMELMLIMPHGSMESWLKLIAEINDLDRYVPIAESGLSGGQE